MNQNKNVNVRKCEDKCFTIAMINKEISDLLRKTENAKKLVLLQNFVEKIKIETYIKRLKLCFYVFLCLLMLACVLKMGFFDKFVNWGFRRTSIKLVTKLDWFKYRNQKCYISNPAKHVRQLEVEDCEQCETINRVTVINDTYGSDFMKLVKQDIPVALPNSVADEVKAYENVTDFVDLFLSIDDFALYEPCGFASNLKRKVDDHRHLLQLIASHDVGSFYTHWENCADVSYKSFRRFYGRPKFLPPNIQLTDSNWAMLCSDYDGRTLKQIEVISPLFIMMVVKGHAEITLSPRVICKGYCSDEIRKTLHEGTVLLLTDSFWLLKYTPSCKDDETILIGINGYFD